MRAWPEAKVAHHGSVPAARCPGGLARGIHFPARGKVGTRKPQFASRRRSTGEEGKVVDAAEIPLLPAHTWETSYHHVDGDLVRLFYVPALSCATQYDRTTGYFSADALVLAARDIERLIANGGKMRLIVGCTLDVDEIEAIERGYDLREQVAKKLASIDLTPPDPRDRYGLEALAWMVANELLDIKVAVPTNAEGEPIVLRGIYHEKVGIITDRESNRLYFSGSINETGAGWISNRESFHVHLSWEGGRDFKHVQDEVEAFEKLGAGRAWSVQVLDFPRPPGHNFSSFSRETTGS
jgi:hypothetical protein